MSEWMFESQQIADNKAYDWLESRPICDCCEEHIQENVYYETENGLKYCINCITTKRFDEGD